MRRTATNLLTTVPNKGQRACLLLFLWLLLACISHVMLLSTYSMTASPTTTRNASDLDYDKLSSSPLLLAAHCPADFTAKGGVVIFFHLAKAAGTTIREFFQEVGGPTTVTKIRVRNLRKRNNPTFRLIDQWVNGHGDMFFDETVHTNRSKTLFIEIHDGPNPTLRQMTDQLQAWRSRADRAGVPFFVFTVLRQPVAYALSFYNFQHVTRRTRRYAKGNNTQQDLLRLLPAHPQCMFYARGEEATTTRARHKGANLTVAECVATYDVMRRAMDWIGRTETLRNETLPWLSHLLTGTASHADTFTARNVRHNKARRRELHYANLTVAGRDALRDKIAADFYLHRRATQEFPAALWQTCLTDQTTP